MRSNRPQDITPVRSLVNRLVGYGIWSIYMANTLQDVKRRCDEEGYDLPFPEMFGEYPIALGSQMNAFCNLEMPNGIAMNLNIVEVEPHKHRDKYGAEISCETRQYLLDRDNYAGIAMWESGETVVSTIWVGDDDCDFETRVFSSDSRWNGHAMEYKTLAEAEAGHLAIVKAIEAYPPSENREATPE